MTQIYEQNTVRAQILRHSFGRTTSQSVNQVTCGGLLGSGLRLDLLTNREAATSKNLFDKEPQ